LDIFQDFFLDPESEEPRKKPENQESETVFQHFVDMAADSLTYHMSFEMRPHYLAKCSLEEEIGAYSNSFDEDTEKAHALECFLGVTLSFHAGIAVQRLFLLKPVEDFCSNTDDVLSVHDGFDQSRNGVGIFCY
jgi:hypothetical protein